MTKYHKNINFPHEKLLHLFILTVNKKYKVLTKHAKKRILERIGNISEVGIFIRDYKIKYNDIIEYTFKNGHIERILIRTSLNKNNDIILSISYDGYILTCYLNKKIDNHYTLNLKKYAC